MKQQVFSMRRTDEELTKQFYRDKWVPDAIRDDDPDPEPSSMLTIFRSGRKLTLPKEELSPEEITTVLEGMEASVAKSQSRLDTDRFIREFLRPFFDGTAHNAFERIDELLRGMIEDRDGKSELQLADQVMSIYYHAADPEFRPRLRTHYTDLFRARIHPN